MPLQNRVDPFGELLAVPARGLFMGNRGGRFHTGAKTLASRHWVSRQWISCAINFRGRHREVWGRSYTELFFLDEPTLLAAGHRPCFECRYEHAKAFAKAWGEGRGLSRRPKAREMDEVLHGERLRGDSKRVYFCAADTLPDGAFVVLDGAAFAIRGTRLLRWTPEGYAGAKPRLRGITVEVLTPPAILAALSAGYQPRWHPSANR